MLPLKCTTKLHLLTLLNRVPTFRLPLHVQVFISFINSWPSDLNEQIPISILIHSRQRWEQPRDTRTVLKRVSIQSQESKCVHSHRRQNQTGSRELWGLTSCLGVCFSGLFPDRNLRHNFAAMAMVEQPRPLSSPSTSGTAMVPSWLNAQLQYLRMHSPVPLKVWT